MQTFLATTLQVRWSVSVQHQNWVLTVCPISIMPPTILKLLAPAVIGAAALVVENAGVRTPTILPELVLLASKAMNPATVVSITRTFHDSYLVNF